MHNRGNMRKKVNMGNIKVNNCNKGSMDNKSNRGNNGNMVNKSNNCKR